MPSSLLSFDIFSLTLCLSLSPFSFSLSLLLLVLLLLLLLALLLLLLLLWSWRCSFWIPLGGGDVVDVVVLLLLLLFIGGVVFDVVPLLSARAPRVETWRRKAARGLQERARALSFTVSRARCSSARVTYFSLLATPAEAPAR